MNKKIVSLVFSFTLLPLATQIATASQAARNNTPRSTTEAITAQATKEAGDIYRGTVFGAEQKKYDGTVLGTRTTATKKYVYDTSLIRAVKIGDADRVRTLLYAHVDANEKNYAGISPLTIAAEKGNMDIIQMLVEDGHANVNDVSSYGITPLIAAAAAGRGEAIEYLVKNGADVTAKDDTGKTALLYAVNFDAPKAVESLIKLDNKAINLPDKEGNTPLVYAAQKGLSNNAKALITYGASVDYRNPTTGLSPLAAASAEGHSQMVRLLVKNGHADINLSDLEGRTPIFYAVDQNKVDTLRTLISLGADINAQDINGTTPLMLAAAKGRQDCFNLLMRQKNINVSQKDLQNRTALSYSAYAPDTAPAEKLLAVGGNINERDTAGNTPLLDSITAKNEKMALFFVQNGADLSVANNAGQNAFTLAETYLPQSAVSSVLGVKRAGIEQQALQVEAEKLSTVRALEQELASQEAAVAQLKAEQEAAARELAQQKEAAVRAKLEQEYQAKAAQLENDPELQQLEQQLAAAKAKKQAALQQEMDNRLAQELGTGVATAQTAVNNQTTAAESTVQQAKTQAANQVNQTKQAAKKRNTAARNQTKKTATAVRNQAASTRSAVNEVIPKASVAPEEVSMTDFLKARQ